MGNGQLLSLTPHHGFALGRRAPVRQVGWRARTIEHYATLPAPAASFDHTQGFDGFKMLGNGPDPTLTVNGGNPVGDCGWVGSVNVDLIESLETGERFVWPTSDEVVTDYLRYDHGQDLGVDLSTFLTYWQTVGLPWGGKIAGHAEVDLQGGVDRAWAAANAFGCLYIGIAVPAPMDEQAASGEILDLTGTSDDRDIQGGHCVVVVSRDADVGNGQSGGELATWGMRVKFTDRWLQTYMEEAHVAITGAQVERNGDGYGLDLASLQADLKLV